MSDQMVTRKATPPEVILCAKLKRSILAEIETDLKDLEKTQITTDLETVLVARIKVYKRMLNRAGITS